MSLSFIPSNTNFDFIRIRFIAFAVSAIMIFGTFALMATKGFNYGIDFTGGTLVEVGVPEVPDLATLRASLNDLDLGDVSLQEFGDPQTLLIRLQQQDGGPEAQTAAIAKVRAALDGQFEGVDYRRTEFVGPQVGEELKLKALYAVLFSMIGILIYVAVRFEWQFGVAAILSLLHDVVSVIGFYILTGQTFDLTAVAAVLMIAGYSINDTVVIFDRIRETMRKYKKMPMGELLNRAINDTLSRTVVTGITTIFALIALWIFGGEVIRGFVEAMLFGVLLGTYSSVFMAAPILLYFRIRPKDAAPAETAA